ncbi:hypothetical protein M3J09_001458 [Ascochyta lentis]
MIFEVAKVRYACSSLPYPRERDSITEVELYRRLRAWWGCVHVVQRRGVQWAGIVVVGWLRFKEGGHWWGPGCEEVVAVP